VTAYFHSDIAVFNVCRMMIIAVL